MIPDEIPEVSEALVKYLEEAFPEESYRPGTDHDSYVFQGGKRDLIRWLRATHEAQQEDK